MGLHCSLTCASFLLLCGAVVAQGSPIHWEDMGSKLQDHVEILVVDLTRKSVGISNDIKLTQSSK